MTPEQATWVRRHAWPPLLSHLDAQAAAHPELAAEDTGCVCQLGPCFWCQTGRHHKCRTTGPETPATLLGHHDGWAYRYSDGRVINVWLADRTCRANCPCDCRQPAHERGLLFDLTTTDHGRHSA